MVNHLNALEIDLDWVADVGSAANPEGSRNYQTPAIFDNPQTITHNTRRFCSKTAAKVWSLDAIPCITGVQMETTKLLLGENLRSFGQVTISLQDFVDDDRLEDPHFAAWSHDTSAGTYFGKLLARNPYVHGSPAPSIVRSRWFGNQDEQIASRTAFTLTQQFRDGRTTYAFTTGRHLAALDLGDVITLTSRDLTDTTGQPKPQTCIIQRTPSPNGLSIQFLAEPFFNPVRFVHVMANNQTDNYENTPSELRDPGWFLSGSDEKLPGVEDPAYGLA